MLGLLAVSLAYACSQVMVFQGNGLLVESGWRARRFQLALEATELACLQEFGDGVLAES